MSRLSSFCQRYSIALAALVAVLLLGFTPEGALAQNQWFNNGNVDTGVLEETGSRLWLIYDFAKQAVYIGGGMGLIVMAVFAFFGRFKWTHFMSLAGGLFLVAVFAELISFLGGDSQGVIN